MADEHASTMRGKGETVDRIRARVSRLPLALVVAALALSCSAGGEGDGDALVFPDIHIGKPDNGFQPDIQPADNQDPLDNQVPTPDLPAETPPTTIGCGDGVCSGAETPANCAKDCLTVPTVSAFVFAHKGDEIGSLGRIQDLLMAGTSVFVFYVTFDETPIAQFYGDSAGKLSVASLGVPAGNIYLYEKFIEWDVATGNHGVLDRLVQHFLALEPSAVYLPQLCGGDLEAELAHNVGYWAAKLAKLPMDPEFQFYEVPARSNYYFLSDPTPQLAAQNPDEYVGRFIKRWKLIPKSTDELKPTLGPDDMAKLRLAAAHIQNAWFQEGLGKLPEDRLLYALREVQRFRTLPSNHDLDKRPYLESLDNPSGTFIYDEQGYTYDEYKQFSRVVRSFSGTNVRTNPPAMPWYDDPMEVIIAHKFDVELDIRVFSTQPDTLSFKVAFGPAKGPTEDCAEPEPLQVDSLQNVKVTVHCSAMEPIGQHTYYFRVYSQAAKELGEPAKYSEVPLKVKVYQ